MTERGRGLVPRSIAVRLGILFAFGSALLLSGIGIYLHAALERQLAARNYEHLIGMTELVRHVLGDVRSADELISDPNVVGHLLIGHPQMQLWVYAGNGRRLFASLPTSIRREDWDIVEPHDYVTIATGFWQDSPRNAYRYSVARVHTDKPGLSEAEIVVALDASQELHELRAFRGTLFVTMAIAALLAASLGFFVTGQALRPIVRIADAARRITASQLGERLEPRGAPKELDALVESFNTMLARLEDSFRRLSDFSADLAHELRTPLTTLLGRTQVTLALGRTAQEYRQALESNVEEVERLSALVSDMLFIARADHAEAALVREHVDLRAEAERLVEFFQLACEERGIHITVRGRAAIHGDRKMIERALGNLLSNAIRYSPDSERIEVVIEGEPKTVAVSVIDRGPGLSREQQQRVFDRFYRADPSRTRNSGGTGLGLAIVRSIVELHGGDVSIESGSGAPTKLTMRFAHEAENTSDPIRV